jgi:peroxiredoxin
MPRSVILWLSIAVAGLGVGVALFLSHQPDDLAAEAELASPAATVNGVAITQELVERELAVSRLNVAAPLPPLTGEDLARAREEALNQLISRQLILQEAGRQGFRLAPDVIEAQAELLFGTEDDEALGQALAQAGVGQSDLLWWVGEILTVEEFVAQVVMAGAGPEERQQVYNEWLNSRRADAQIEVYAGDQLQIVRPLTGGAAPDFNLTSLDGRKVSLSDYRGQVVLLNFWTTWCSSCLTELPDYEQIYRQHSPEFVVLGVNLQEDTPQVQQYAAGLGLTFPILLDQDGRIASRQYQLVGLPGSFIIDRQGEIVYQHLGPMSGETLAAKLAALGL